MNKNILITGASGNLGKAVVKKFVHEQDHIAALIPPYGDEKMFESEAVNVYKVDLTKLGYDKLLGTGQVTKKLEITVKYASPKALEKVNAAGGKIELLAGEEPEAPEAPKTPEKPAPEAPAAE